MNDMERSRPYRVLVVDDEVSQLAATVSIVNDELENVEVKEAGTEDEAERILKEKASPFDLAIIDMRLGIDAEGVKLTGVIKHVMLRHSQTRIVIFTAYPEWRTAVNAMDSGADAYISKLDEDATDQLRKKVRDLLERRVEREELARQVESQQAGEAAFEVHCSDWQEQYSGSFILVRNDRVEGAYESGEKAWEAMRKMSMAERLEIGIIYVRQEESK